MKAKISGFLFILTLHASAIACTCLLFSINEPLGRVVENKVYDMKGQVGYFEGINTMETLGDFVGYVSGAALYGRYGYMGDISGNKIFSPSGLIGYGENCSSEQLAAAALLLL